MIVRITRAKVGHRQAPFRTKPGHCAGPRRIRDQHNCDSRIAPAPGPMLRTLNDALGAWTLGRTASLELCVAQNASNSAMRFACDPISAAFAPLRRRLDAQPFRRRWKVGDRSFASPASLGLFRGPASTRDRVDRARGRRLRPTRKTIRMKSQEMQRAG